MFAWLVGKRKRSLGSTSPRRSGQPASRQHFFRPQVEALEERALPSVTIMPETNGFVGVNPGHNVEFRKGPPGFISDTDDSLASVDSLFARLRTSAKVIADATDNGVAVINYEDNGGGNDFSSPRDVGNSTLQMVKQTIPPNPAAPDVNSGTFNPFAEDDEFGMVSSGFIYIPTAGSWTFSIKSDDACRLIMGTTNAIVTEFDGSRPPEYGNNQGGDIDSVAVVPSAGYYRYQLVWNQGDGGAMAQFAAVVGSFPQPTDGGAGSLPKGSQLVGDTANGGLAVYQSGLRVNMTGRATAVPLSTITYNIGVQNILPPIPPNGTQVAPFHANAVKVTLTDTVPAYTTFVSATKPLGWSISAPPVGGTGLVTFATSALPAGSTANFTLKVWVKLSTPSYTVISNSATAQSGSQSITSPVVNTQILLKILGHVFN